MLNVTSGVIRDAETQLQFAPVRRSLAARFAQKWVGDPNSGCWLWTAACLKNRYGEDTYGVIGVGRLGTILAHRASYILHNERLIPAGVLVLHGCDTPQCVNPAHLTLGSPVNNGADMAARSRAERGEARWNAKLSPEKIRAIRASKDSLSEIVERFGISKGHASGIRSGQEWKWVRDAQ